MKIPSTICALVAAYIYISVAAVSTLMFALGVIITESTNTSPAPTFFYIFLTLISGAWTTFLVVGVRQIHRLRTFADEIRVRELVTAQVEVAQNKQARAEIDSLVPSAGR